MPLYDYQCEECERVFQKFSTVEHRRRVKKCPECEGPARKLVSSARFNPFRAKRWIALQHEPYVTSNTQLREELKVAGDQLGADLESDELPL